MSSFDKITLLSGTVGSRLYGTAGPESDTDTMSIILEPAEKYLLGFQTTSWQSGEQSEYELRFFVNLCRAANLNVLPLLWSEVWTHDISRYGMDAISLRAQRNRFLSKRLHPVGTGYATAQLQDVQNPDRATGKLGSKRKALVDLHGYDTKSALHAVRLARMTREYLRIPEAGLIVRRPDSEELRAIRDGKWTKEAVVKEVTSLIADCDKLVRSSAAPDSPDTEWIDSFLIGVLSRHIKENL